MKHLNIYSKILGAAAMLLLPLSASADDVLGMSINGTDGKSLSFYNLDDISKIVFDESGFDVRTTDGSLELESFTYDEVGSIKFGTATGIDNVKADMEDGEISVIYSGSALSISGCSQNDVAMIFDISGRPVMRTNVNGSVQMSTEALSSGIYILKVGSKTFKFNK